MPNRTSTGQEFGAQVLAAVWTKGREIPNYNSGMWRWDVCGMVMRWDAYGNRASEYGWEVDHVRPVARGGVDAIENLQPLNWRNNAAKGDTFPWNCG